MQRAVRRSVERMREAVASEQYGCSARVSDDVCLLLETHHKRFVQLTLSLTWLEPPRSPRSFLPSSSRIMSTPQRLSDDPTLQPLLKSTFSAAVKAGELYNIKASDLKARLLDAGWTGPGASEKGWKAGWKSTVSEEWKRMVVSPHY